jgi:hypothetical protein
MRGAPSGDGSGFLAQIFGGVARPSPWSASAPDTTQRTDLSTCSGSGANRAKEEATRGTRSGLGSAQKRSKASSSAGRDVLELCLLQTADGSFLLDQRLATVLRLSVEQLQAVAAQIVRSAAPDMAADSRTCGTVAALLALWVLFPEQRAVLELQEGKALSFLARRSPSRSFTAAQLEAGVPAMKALLQRGS